MQKLSWKSIQEQFPKYAAKYANEFKDLFSKLGKTELSIEDIDNYLNQEISLTAYKIGGYVRYFNDTAGRVLGRIEVADNGDSQCYDIGGSLLGMVVGGQTYASNGVLLSPQDILSTLLVKEDRIQASNKSLFKNLVSWFRSASYELEKFKSKTIGEYEIQLNEVYFEENNKRSYDSAEVSVWPIEFVEGKPGKVPSREPIKIKKFYNTKDTYAIQEAEEMYNKINNIEDFNLLNGKQADVLTQSTLFDINTADEVVNRLQSELQVPFISTQKSILGGDENVAIIVNISLDEKDTWYNNIFQNSRYSMFYIYRDGKIEQFSKHYNLLNFRKTKAKSIDDLITKLNNYFTSVQNITATKQADERLLHPRIQVPEEYIPTYTPKYDPAEWTSYSMEDIYTDEEIEEEQPKSKYIPKKKQRGKYNLHEIVMTPEGRGRIIMKQVDYEPFSYTVALTGKDEITIVEEPQIQRLARVQKKAVTTEDFRRGIQNLWVENIHYSNSLREIRGKEEFINGIVRLFEELPKQANTNKQATYSIEYFKNPLVAEKANKYGLVDIENEDLTAPGLIVKMHEWDEMEHGVPSYIYDMTKKDLELQGEKMPEDIRRIEGNRKYYTMASTNKQAKRNDARYWAMGNLELWVDGDQLEYDDEIKKIKNLDLPVEEKIIRAKDRIETLVLNAINSLKVSSEYSDVVYLNSFRSTEVLDVDERVDNINYFDLVSSEVEEDVESLKESSLIKNVPNRQANSESILKDITEAVSSWEFKEFVAEVFIVNPWRKERYFGVLESVSEGTVVIYTNEESTLILDELQRLLPQYFLEPISHYAIGVYSTTDDETYEDIEEGHIKGSIKSAKSVGWLRDKFLKKINKIADVAAEVNDEFKKEREDGEGRGISLIDYYTTGRYYEIEKPLSEDAITKTQAEKLMEDLVYQFKTELFAIYNISSSKADEIVDEPKGVSMKDIEDLEEGAEKESAIEKEIEFYPMDSISTGYPSTQYLKDIVEPVKQPEGKYLSY